MNASARLFEEENLLRTSFEATRSDGMASPGIRFIETGIIQAESMTKVDGKTVLVPEPTGYYDVLGVYTGAFYKNIPFVPNYADPLSREGIVRLPKTREPCLIGCDIQGRRFIMSGAPHMSTDETGSWINRFRFDNRNLRPGEIYIRGPRGSRLIFKESGEFEIAPSNLVDSRYSNIRSRDLESPLQGIRFDPDSGLFVTAHGSQYINACGYENWGMMIDVSDTNPVPELSPARKTTFVMSRRYDDTSPFVETMEGNLSKTGSPIIEGMEGPSTSPVEAPIYQRNINNAVATRGFADGKYQIVGNLLASGTGIGGGLTGSSILSPEAISAIASRSGLKIELDPNRPVPGAAGKAFPKNGTIDIMAAGAINIGGGPTRPSPSGLTPEPTMSLNIASVVTNITGSLPDDSSNLPLGTLNIREGYVNIEATKITLKCPGGIASINITPLGIVIMGPIIRIN